MAEISAADVKLIQYLNEAYGMESRLETALEAHIAMATRVSYRKRLREHLAETKRHARMVKQRVRALGGAAETISAPGPQQVSGAAQAVLSAGQKAVALAQGPMHALRGTGEGEKQLKNAKTEYASESEEIATYTAIETLSEMIGDTETRKLAREIRREEERMRAYLEKEIPRLTKAMASAEIPASQRRSPRKASSRRAKKASTSAKPAPRAKATATRAKAASSRAKGAGRAKAASSRAKASGRAKGAGRAKAASSRAKASGRAKASAGRARTASGRSKRASGRATASAGRAAGARAKRPTARTR
jgi:ferritin-like metal-binding protein YciE